MKSRSMKEIVKGLFCGVSVAALLVAPALLVGCGGDGGTQEVSQPMPGEVLYVDVEREEDRQATPTLVYQATYRWTEMNEAESAADTPEEPTVFALLESETYHDPAFQSVMPATDPVTAEELRAFLRDHWDEFHGGVEDEGWNLESFITFLSDYRISWEEFFDMWEDWQALGHTLPELVDWIRRSGSRGLDEALLASRVDPGPYLDAAISATKLAWDIVKDNAPVTNVHGAFTAVLNPDDMNWTHYAGARNDRTGVHRLHYYNGFGVTNVDVKFRVRCTYNADHPTLGGVYIPSLYVDFEGVYALWPVSINGDASLSSISNIGTTENPNPQVDMIVSLNPHTWLMNITRSFRFRATGTGGV